LVGRKFFLFRAGILSLFRAIALPKETRN
jgi:hypothetical protein